MSWNLDDYEPVDLRIEKFWAKYPDGQIITEPIDAEPGTFIFRAELHSDPHENLIATGYAREEIATSGVNKTSALENCETSAIGRALANAGFAAKGKRPSREEMQSTMPDRPAAAETIHGVVALVEWANTVVADIDVAQWVRDQQYAWPWTAEACAAIAAGVGRAVTGTWNGTVEETTGDEGSSTETDGEKLPLDA